MLLFCLWIGIAHREAFQRAWLQKSIADMAKCYTVREIRDHGDILESTMRVYYGRLFIGTVEVRLQEENLSVQMKDGIHIPGWNWDMLTELSQDYIDEALMVIDLELPAYEKAFWSPEPENLQRQEPVSVRKGKSDICEVWINREDALEAPIQIYTIPGERIVSMEVDTLGLEVKIASFATDSGENGLEIRVEGTPMEGWSGRLDGRLIGNRLTGDLQIYGKSDKIYSYGM